jgi:hypothetical protein
VAFVAELLHVARVEYAYSKVYVILMVDGMGSFRGLLEFYLGGPVIEQRMVVVARKAEGICFFKEQWVEALWPLRLFGLDVLVLKLRGATLDLEILRTTRVQPSEAGEFLEEVGTIMGVKR